LIRGLDLIEQEPDAGIDGSDLCLPRGKATAAPRFELAGSETPEQADDRGIAARRTAGRQHAVQPARARRLDDACADGPGLGDALEHGDLVASAREQDRRGSARGAAPDHADAHGHRWKRTMCRWTWCSNRRGGSRNRFGAQRPRPLMKLLLDTHVFIWMHGDPDRLSARARELLIDADAELHLSVVVAWELGITRALDLARTTRRVCDVSRTACTHVAVVHRSRSCARGHRAPIPSRRPVRSYAGRAGAQRA
jgi:hypothetical protein